MERLCKVYRCLFERNLMKKLILEKFYSIIIFLFGMLEIIVFWDIEFIVDDEFVEGLSGFVEFIVVELFISKLIKCISNRVVLGILIKRKLFEDKGKSRKKGVLKYFCGICKKECKSNMVGCDGCDLWF